MAVEFQKCRLKNVLNVRMFNCKIFLVNIRIVEIRLIEIIIDYMKHLLLRIINTTSNKSKLTKTVDRHIPFLLYDNTSINGGRLLYFAPETIFRNCDIYNFNAYFLGKDASNFFLFCNIVVDSQGFPRNLFLS